MEYKEINYTLFGKKIEPRKEITLEDIKNANEHFKIYNIPTKIKYSAIISFEAIMRIVPNVNIKKLKYCKKHNLPYYYNGVNYYVSKHLKYTRFPI